MVETHPFGIFVPPKVKYLLLGSFTTKEANFDPSYDWYYGSKRNQFWKILEEVYGRLLKNKVQKKKLFTNLEMAMGDIIYQCERRRNSNLDMNLITLPSSSPRYAAMKTTEKIRRYRELLPPLPKKD